MKIERLMTTTISKRDSGDLEIRATVRLVDLERLEFELALFENMIIDLQSQKEKLDEERDDLKAELAQLQADQDKAIKEIERLVELNNKLQENEKRFIDEEYNKEKEIKNLKGALRTLAEIHVTVSPISCDACKIRDAGLCDPETTGCDQRHINYALANPTEEVKR